jgi:hypothetical protein
MIMNEIFPKIDWDGYAAQSFAGELINKVEAYNKRPMWCSAFILKELKSGELTSIITGRPQQAICVYCNKAIIAWGKKPNAKRGYVKCPELENVHTKHTPDCRNKWLYNTLYNWALGRLDGRYDSFISEIIRRNDRSDKYNPDYCVGTWIARVLNILPARIGSEKAIETEILFNSFVELTHGHV